jgi:hypothetical protein
MKVEYKDFIGIYSDVFEEGFCSHVISEFERHILLGAGSDRFQAEGAQKHYKDDHFIFNNGRDIVFEKFGEVFVHDVFWEKLQSCFDKYSMQYSTLRDVRLNAHIMKIQKTSEGGGYHLWHSEQGNEDQARRAVVYMLYLNTLPEGANGETEFIYQHRRIAPVENTMVLWPASFTHSHRGNPVYGKEAKYIITGWFYLT